MPLVLMTLLSQNQIKDTKCERLGSLPILPECARIMGGRGSQMLSFVGIEVWAWEIWLPVSCQSKQSRSACRGSCSAKRAKSRVTNLTSIKTFHDIYQAFNRRSSQRMHTGSVESPLRKYWPSSKPPPR